MLSIWDLSNHTIVSEQFLRVVGGKGDGKRLQPKENHVKKEQLVFTSPQIMSEETGKIMVPMKSIILKVICGKTITIPMIIISAACESIAPIRRKELEREINNHFQ